MEESAMHQLCKCTYTYLLFFYYRFFFDTGHAIGFKAEVCISIWRWYSGWLHIPCECTDAQVSSSPGQTSLKVSHTSQTHIYVTYVLWFDSGERAFKNMTIPYTWPQRPMMERAGMISPSLPMTFIYGSRSNIDGQSGKAMQEIRPNSYTEIKVSFT